MTSSAARKRLHRASPRVGLRTFAVLMTGIVAWIALPQAALRSQAPVKAKYMDVTAASGVNYRHVSSATPSKYLLETMGGGVALFDYDNDAQPSKTGQGQHQSGTSGPFQEPAP